MNWSDVLGAGALVPLFTAALRLAVPIILAAAGACLAERSGLMNLGIEGQMMVGAIIAFLTVYYTGQPMLGAATGAAAGLVLAAIVGYLTITMAVDQIITGISVVILGTGLASFLYLQVFGVTGTPPRIQVSRRGARRRHGRPDPGAATASERSASRGRTRVRS